MFLNILNDKQKNLFQKLAIKAAEANGIVELEEKNMLKCFAVEMNIEPFYSTDVSLDSLLAEIMDNSNEQILRIFTFEIIAIMISDSEFDEEEKRFVNLIISKFGIAREKADEMIDSLYEYMNIFNKINSVVL